MSETSRTCAPCTRETLQFLVSTAGFRNAEIVYRSPYPDEERLRQVEGLGGAAASDGGEDPAADLARVAAVLNRNVETLNRLLFADQDYAVVAERA